MKIFSTLVFACILMHVLNAQPLPNYLQTTTFGNVTPFSDGGSGDAGSMNFMGGGGGGYGDSKLFSEYDSDGNICSAGVFVNTVDFDPGSGVTSFTATGNDGFIQKLSPEGELLWVKPLPEQGDLVLRILQLMPMTLFMLPFILMELWISIQE